MVIEDQLANFLFSLSLSSISAAAMGRSGRITYPQPVLCGRYNLCPFEEHPWDILIPLRYQSGMVGEGCNHNREYHLPMESYWT